MKGAILSCIPDVICCRNPFCQHFFVILNVLRPPQVPRFGNLRVTTTNLTAGWLRKNGVPYSENATVTEYFDRFQAPNTDEWLVVTTIVSDSRYLNQDFVTSSHFKKEPNGSKWAPSPCKA